MPGFLLSQLVCVVHCLRALTPDNNEPYPGVVFSIAGHRYALVVRSIFLALSGLGLVFGIIVNTKTADLYEGNAHHTIGWLATGIVAVHALIDVLLRFVKRPSTDNSQATERDGRRSGINGQVSGLSCPYSGHQYHPSGEGARSESDEDEESMDEYKSLVSRSPALSEIPTFSQVLSSSDPRLGLIWTA